MPFWMNPPAHAGDCLIAAYRSSSCFEEECELTWQASADEFCRLYIDGKRFTFGPERGSKKYWYAMDGKLTVPPGKHCLCAEVFCFGIEKTAFAQESIAHGFFWKDSQDRFNHWETKLLDAISFEVPFPDWGTYPRVHVENTYDPSVFSGDGNGWAPVTLRDDPRILHRRSLPAMRFEKTDDWTLSGGVVTFKHYTCSYGHYRFRGCGTVRLRWSETPYETPQFDPLHLVGQKGNRKGKYFLGNHDVFEVNGEYTWDDFFFHAGRFLEIETSGSVEVVEICFYETGYPWQFKTLPDLGSRAANHFAGIAIRTLQRCTWETFMDCPFYEQIMYVGDSRIASLLLYQLTDDRALIEKCLRFFAMTQQEHGMILSHYPAKFDQMIPSFSITWILMILEYAEHGGKPELIRELLPITRKILDHFPPDNGWFFLDWVKSWENGVPSGDCSLNWLYCLSLEAQVKLEQQYGRPDYEDLYKRKSEALAEHLLRNYWCPAKGLFAEPPGGSEYTEHAQVLALLSSKLHTTMAKTILQSMRSHDFGDSVTGSYFSFFYLSAMKKYHQNDLFNKKLAPFLMFEKQGLDTTPENFAVTRSDCHVWSAHPLIFLLQEANNRQTQCSSPFPAQPKLQCVRK